MLVEPHPTIPGGDQDVAGGDFLTGTQPHPPPVVDRGQPLGVLADQVAAGRLQGTLPTLHELRTGGGIRQEVGDVPDLGNGAAKRAALDEAGRHADRVGDQRTRQPGRPGSNYGDVVHGAEGTVVEGRLIQQLLRVDCDFCCAQVERDKGFRSMKGPLGFQTGAPGSSWQLGVTRLRIEISCQTQEAARRVVRVGSLGRAAVGEVPHG